MKWDSVFVRLFFFSLLACGQAYEIVLLITDHLACKKKDEVVEHVQCGRHSHLQKTTLAVPGWKSN